jgi:AcrR family transcriptional regulator
LFAREGYDATATSKVAREAGVSEGLIFRHFSNKQGLLEAILEQGQQRAAALYADALGHSSPEAVLRAVIAIPFQISPEEYDFWRLIYALKWQAETYDSAMSDPVRNRLPEVFEALGYADPAAETELILVLTDGLATALLLRNPDAQALHAAILRRYGLD